MGHSIKIILDDSDEQVTYRIDPKIVMNGSVVYIQKESKFYAIGIQIKDGTAIYLNSLRIQIIRRWIQEYCFNYISILEHNLYSSLNFKYDLHLNYHQDSNTITA